MRFLPFIVLLAAVSLRAEKAPSPDKPERPAASLSFQRAEARLQGPFSGQQLIVTDAAGEHERDVTASADFSASPEGVVAIDSAGYVTPLADGTATIRAVVPDRSGKPATTKITVANHGETPTTHFQNDVVPVFTKYGCNGGGCHGKSGGQNNFRLSLLGYEPWKDHEWLVRESRGRRVSPAAPENSLLLMKATGEIPHEGGSRLAKSSPDYDTLARWIRQGMPYASEDEPKVERISVFPKERVVAPGSSQQLSVSVRFTDGTSRDITRTAIFEANQEDMAEVDEAGRVVFGKNPGSTSVMIRFQEHVDVFRATIPLGRALEELPQPENFIDERIFEKLTLLGLPPSPRTDDASFLRRVTVDIAGRLPTAEETNDFLASDDPDKRSSKIDALLDSPDYAAYFAQKWSGILRNKRTKDTYQRGTFAFHEWLRVSLENNKPFDRLVTELITASGETGRNPEVGWYRAVKDQTEQMQDIAQVFLGIRMQCAQCHHHPYEKWSQDDYYGFTAFFSAVGRKAGEQPDEDIVFHKLVPATMENPNTGEKLKPTPLGADPLDIPAESDPRKALAEWMTGEDNPWFADMLVNRYWKHFFSVGLVDPEDDMRVTNPASHPELLDALGSHFAAGGYDLKELIRTICNSRTYQASAVPNDHNVTDARNFSRYYPKRLAAEVLLDAINLVFDSRESFQNQPAGVRTTWLPDDAFNKDSFFLSVFGRPEMNSACECERVADANLAQSLHLINSDTIQDKLGHDEGRAAALAAATDRPDKDRISELYLSAVSRQPRSEELQTAQAHLTRKRQQAEESPDDELTPEKAEREAFEDLLWALVNTKEFLFNH